MKLRHQLFNLGLGRLKKTECHQYLSKWNSYYKGLSPELKEHFVIRTILFLRSTDFSTERKYRLSKDMLYMVSGAFVQVSFGLSLESLEIFNRIFIAPRAYSYRGHKSLFHGDVNPNTQTVTLSWPALKKGFEIADDGINLALHEFAHCLILENKSRSFLRQFLDSDELRNWQKLAEKVMYQMRNEKKGELIRDYGGTDIMELFAASLELFFEKPDQLYGRAPKMYESMSRLLMQDPRFPENPLLD